MGQGRSVAPWKKADKEKILNVRRDIEKGKEI
jgi:hypothetical protein